MANRLVEANLGLSLPTARKACAKPFAWLDTSLMGRKDVEASALSPIRLGTFSPVSESRMPPADTAMETMMMRIKMETLTMAKKLFRMIPPLLETVWMKHVAVATAIAMPLTDALEKSSGVLPGWLAWRARMAKATAFPAMPPMQIKAMP